MTTHPVRDWTATPGVPGVVIPRPSGVVAADATPTAATVDPVDAPGDTGAATEGAVVTVTPADEADTASEARRRPRRGMDTTTSREA